MLALTCDSYLFRQRTMSSLKFTMADRLKGTDKNVWYVSKELEDRPKIVLSYTDILG